MPFATGQVFDSNDSCVEFPVFDGGETYFGSRPKGDARGCHPISIVAGSTDVPE